jgi:hypothetical protein
VLVEAADTGAEVFVVSEVEGTEDVPEFGEGRLEVVDGKGTEETAFVAEEGKKVLMDACPLRGAVPFFCFPILKRRSLHEMLAVRLST